MQKGKPDEIKPMSFHIPTSLKERLTAIAKADKRSLTQQMIVMLEEAASQRERTDHAA